MANIGSTNNKDEKSVNTRGIQFKNKLGFDPSTVSFAFWNDMLSIRMNPALPQDQQTNNKVYDYDKTVSTALSVSKVALLLEKVTKEVIPALSAGENKTVGVVVGGDSLVCVGTGKALTGEIKPYISIHKSLNQETYKPEMSIYYEFNKEQSIDDYNAETGKYVCGAEQYPEITVMVAVLKAAMMAMTNAEAHSARHVNQWANDRTNKTLNAIAEKIGAPVPSYGGGTSYNRNTISFSNRPSEDTSSNTTTEMIDDISAIDAFLS